MKNRLEVAREFLRDDGVIFIQCDDNEQAYLKVLCDEIFGRENFVATLVWANTQGGIGSDSMYFRKKHEYILVYTKSKQSLLIYGKEIEDSEKYNLSDEFETTRGKYLLKDLCVGSLGYVPTLDYPIVAPDQTLIYPNLNNEKINRWRWSRDKVEWGLKNDFISFKKKRDGQWGVYTKQYLNCDNEGNIKKRTQQPSSFINKYSNIDSSKHLKTIFGNNVFSYSKPEALIMEILNYATQENDLVMDFFAGSGTTLAVAHKMNRRWIGIEQMDYIESITKERLKKVVGGEQGGISKAVGWQGGGEFVYAELMPLNAIYREKIKDSKDEQELEAIYQDLEQKAFLDYRADLAKMLKDRDFQELDLESKKEILKLILDPNMDYLPYGEIKDESYEIHQEIIALNEKFYEDKQ